MTSLLSIPSKKKPPGGGRGLFTTNRKQSRRTARKAGAPALVRCPTPNAIVALFTRLLRRGHFHHPQRAGDRRMTNHTPLKSNEATTDGAARHASRHSPGHCCAPCCDAPVTTTDTQADALRPHDSTGDTDHTVTAPQAPVTERVTPDRDAVTPPVTPAVTDPHTPHARKEAA